MGRSWEWFRNVYICCIPIKPMVFIKGYKQTAEHRRKIGLASAIFNKGKKANEKQLKSLAEGRRLSHLNAHNRKPFLGKKHTEETRQKIKDKLKKIFPNGRTVNGGNCNYHHQQARKIMEEKLGRKLTSEEIVHHKDRNYRNNSIDNLQIMSISEHVTLHHKQGDIK